MDTAEHHTKTKIKDVALRLFVDKGVSETSVRDLAQAGGIAEGTLYRHYVSKDQLIEDMFSQHYGAFAARMERVEHAQRGVRRKIRAIVRDACALYDENPTLYRFLLLVQHEALQRLPKDRDGPHAVLRRILAEAIERGELKRSDPYLAASLVLGVMVQPALAVVYGMLRGPLSRHAEEMADAAVAVLGK